MTTSLIWYNFIIRICSKQLSLINVNKFYTYKFLIVRLHTRERAWGCSVNITSCDVTNTRLNLPVLCVRSCVRVIVGVCTRVYVHKTICIWWVLHIVLQIMTWHIFSHNSVVSNLLPGRCDVTNLNELVFFLLLIYFFHSSRLLAVFRIGPSEFLAFKVVFNFFNQFYFIVRK